MLLSVRLMTYNHENFIIEALTSINAQQTNFEFEVVIGDDFSTDSTLELIKAFKFTNPNIHVNLLHRVKGETYHALRQKHGRIYNFFDILNHCQGNYIALLDGDDYWIDPLKLQKQVDFLEQNKEYGFCFTRFKTYNESLKTFKIDSNSRYFENQSDFVEFNTNVFVKGWHIGTQTLVFKNSLFPYCGIKKYTFFRDVYLIAEMLMLQNGVCLNDICAVYRLHNQSIHSSVDTLKATKNGLICYKELYRKNPSFVFLKRKYKNFYKYYNQQLLVSKKYIRAFISIVKYSLWFNDVRYLRKAQTKLIKSFFKNC